MSWPAKNEKCDKRSKKELPEFLVEANLIVCFGPCCGQLLNKSQPMLRVVQMESEPHGQLGPIDPSAPKNRGLNLVNKEQTSALTRSARVVPFCHSALVL